MKKIQQKQTEKNVMNTYCNVEYYCLTNLTNNDKFKYR